MNSPPNIILINCDDLGYGDLGCFGSDRHDTPRIDQLAAEGTRLTSFYAASPVCSPSRGAMLTGSYPPRIGFDDFDGLHVLFPGLPVGLHPDEHTLASVLKQAGYATQIVGKWHCGDQPPFLPTRHGFDHWLGLPYSNDMGRQAGGLSDDEQAAIRAAGYTLPPLPYPPLPLLADDAVIEAQPDQTMLTARYVDEALEFVRTHQDHPFFLYFAHMHVHLPLYVEQRFHQSSNNGPYGAAVHAIDWATGVLLDELSTLGLDANTVVMFTSDNGALCRPGEGSNAPLRGTKGSTHEGGMRVPMLIRWPEQIPAGVVNDELSSMLDLLPTVADWAGIELDPHRTIDGRSLNAVLRQQQSSPHQTFAYYNGSALEAVRNQQFKLRLVSGSGAAKVPALALYDLAADPGESTDVIADHPDVVAGLLAAADQYRQQLGDTLTGTVGTARRPIGRVAEPVTLTSYQPDHPYVIAEYDLPDRG
jgi:arylsulfatase A